MDADVPQIQLVYGGIAALLVVCYARGLARGDLQKSGTYAISAVVECPYNVALVQFVICPLFLGVLYLIARDAGGGAFGDVYTSVAVAGVGVGFGVTAGFECTEHPIVHDVGTLVMAVCSLAMLKRIEPDFSDVVGWVGALAAGYSCHFARGLDVPRTVLPSHHAWSFFHGLFQWVLFYYTVVCTTPRAT